MELVVALLAMLTRWWWWWWCDNLHACACASVNECMCVGRGGGEITVTDPLEAKLENILWAHTLALLLFSRMHLDAQTDCKSHTTH